MRLFCLIIYWFPLYVYAQDSEKRYELLPPESKVLWHGENAGGMGGHDGTLQLASGKLVTKGTDLLKGDFVLDMTTIRNTDQKDEKSQRDLEAHLKNADFFEVDKYPNAFFSITKALPLHDPLKPNQYMITGFLGIKGITNSITFPATITTTRTAAKATAVITIDRTKWNVTFQSKTIFSAIKNGALADEIKLTLDLAFIAR
ncbi:MAG: lipid-binding protein [Cytophaga sp.]|nr:lipid-binding protein [Cytophaga sp.]